MAATVAPAMRCLYVDLDGTLLGPGSVAAARRRRSASRRSAVRALEACWRADVEVVLYSGRRQTSVFEGARLIGSSSYIFELGCGLVLDGELEWLTDGLVPSAEQRLDLRPDRGVGRAGAAARALSRAGSSTTRRGRSGARSRTCSADRSTSTRSRAAAVRRPASDGCGWSTTASCASTPSRCPGLPIVHAYHLIPRGGVEGARRRPAHAGARLRARGLHRGRRLARGHGRGRGRRHVLAGRPTRSSATRRSPTSSPAAQACASPSEGYGAGVYEAVVTTLAERARGALDGAQ